MKKNKKFRLKPVRNRFLNNLLITLMIGLLSFLMISAITIITSWIFYFMRKSGFINEKNFYITWMFDYALVCTCVGSLLSVILVHQPVKKTTRLIEAMEKIANGDFSVRLSGKKIGRMTNKTVKIFNNMAKQLESTEILSHDFISNFSHEFKTPIASINGFAKLLKNENISNEEKHEYLDIIIQESERLSNLSINILSLSKLEQQSILTNKSQFNLSEQIRIIIGSLYHKWAEKNIEIDFEGEDMNIVGNKEMLGQVWINLLDNAIKFSHKNKTVTFTLTKEEDCIKASLNNYGDAVTYEQVNRMFDKFWQGDESHSTNGNGLGLPMVKRIIDLHEGNIDVRIGDDSSITFTVTLPA